MNSRLIGYCTVILTLIFSGFEITAQDVTPPKEPVLSYVSVDTGTNYVDVFWKKSPSPDVAGYNLYYVTKTPNGYEREYPPFKSVPASESTYTDSSGLAATKSVLYSISAFDFAGNQSIDTIFHSTIHSTVTYDSCNSKLILRWNKYIGWENNVGGGYYVYARRGNAPFQKLDSKDVDTDSLIIYKLPGDETILENNQYYFYIEGLQNDKFLVSSSNIAAKFTLMPTRPTDFFLDQVTATGPQKVDLKFRFSDASSIDSFALLRSNREFSEFIKVKSFLNTNAFSQTVQDSILTSAERYFYRIGALNGCHVVVGSGTNLGTNILLSGRDTIIDNKQYNLLNWTPYHDFPFDLDHYEIFRIEPLGDTIPMVALGATETFYVDDLSIIYGQGFSGKLTYLIKAIEKGGSNEAYSNFRDVFVRTDIWMPNAFTPNGDNNNDIFKPYFYLTPDKYLMLIYDRFGIVVFSTEDPATGWDGRINENNFAPEGVYIYHVQYSSFNAQPGSKTGSVMVFYPK